MSLKQQQKALKTQSENLVFQMQTKKLTFSYSI